MSQDDWEKEFEPSLPYNGSSGYSGTDTSKDRADYLDKRGITKQRQFETMRLLAKSGANGLTCQELETITELHHGNASSVLSNLHKDGKIARLSLKRKRYKIYVLPEYVIGRNVEKQKPKHCKHCGGVL